MSSESKHPASGDEQRRIAAERNLRIAMFLRQVRWINLVLVGAVLFAGIVAIGAVALTAPPKGTTSDVMPFIVVAGVGQIGAFICMFYGVNVLRLFSQPDAPTSIETPLAIWRSQLRRIRLPMLMLGLISAVVTLFFTGFSVITITGAVLGVAFILQLVILFSVATRDRA